MTLDAHAPCGPDERRVPRSGRKEEPVTRPQAHGGRLLADVEGDLPLGTHEELRRGVRVRSVRVAGAVAPRQRLDARLAKTGPRGIDAPESVLARRDRQRFERSGEVGHVARSTAAPAYPVESARRARAR